MARTERATEPVLRAASPLEADAISILARRSKGYWGYDAAFMDRIDELLTMRAEDIRDGHVVVADRGGALLGFYSLRVYAPDGKPPEAELADLFIDPAAIRTGVGTLLWAHAVRCARERGCAHLNLESDPNAEPFYLRMGAERIGELEVAPGRALPLMSIEL